MKVAVCELHAEIEPGSSEWQGFAARVSRERPDLLLLNEMPFGPWIAAIERPDDAVFEQARRLHEDGLASLGDLGAAVVLGTRPTRHEGRSPVATSSARTGVGARAAARCSGGAVG